MTYTIRFSSFWILVGLLCVTVAVGNLGNAIGKAGRGVSTACTTNQRPHAGP